MAKRYNSRSPRRSGSPSPIQEYTHSKCDNPSDFITLETFSDENKASTIYIIDEEAKTVTCYDRPTLIEWLIGTETNAKVPLVEWVGMNDESGHGGRPTDYPIFKMPSGYQYLDLAAIRSLLYADVHVFFLEKVRTNVGIGNAQGLFGVSMLHGQMKVDVYTLYPEESQLSSKDKEFEETMINSAASVKKEFNAQVVSFIDVIMGIINLSVSLDVIFMLELIFNPAPPALPSIVLTIRPSYYKKVAPAATDAIFASGKWYVAMNKGIEMIKTFFQQIHSPFTYSETSNLSLNSSIYNYEPILSQVIKPQVIFQNFNVYNVQAIVFELVDKDISDPHLVLWMSPEREFVEFRMYPIDSNNEDSSRLFPYQAPPGLQPQPEEEEEEEDDSGNEVIVISSSDEE
jgi:hypothetical protein